jgi:hypothetical protein
MTTKKIIVELDVWDLSIRAFKPVDQNALMMHTSDAGKLLFFNRSSSDRLKRRVMGMLRGRALQKAKRVVDQNGVINISGLYGSIEIDSKNFIEVK